MEDTPEGVRVRARVPAPVAERFARFRIEPESPEAPEAIEADDEALDETPDDDTEQAGPDD